MRTLLAMVLLTCCQWAWGLTWRITTADFRRGNGEIIGLDAQGVHVKDAAQPLAWSQIVMLEANSVQRTALAGPFTLYLADGERLEGKPLAIAEDTLTWSSGAAGEMRFPLKQVRGFASGNLLPSSAQGQDLVILANRDQLRGVIDGIEGGVSVQSELRSSMVRWRDIQALVLAQVEVAAHARPPMRVTMSDGSVLGADAVSLAGETLVVSRGRSELRLQSAAVAAIQNEGGRVRFLSTMEAASYSYAPFVSVSGAKNEGLSHFESTVTPEGTFRNVIAMRPRSHLVYKAPFDGVLHLRYACLDAGPLTNMSLVIAMNKSKVHERADISSAQPSPDLRLPVSANKEVEIVVDYGANADVQDILLLLDAAFVRE